MWPFHQTKSMPADRRDERRERERDDAVEGDVVAERRHPHRVVAHALEGQPEWCPRDVSQQRVDDERHDERDVVEPVRGARRRLPIEVGAGMPLIPPNPETSVTWPKKRLAITE